MIKLAAFDWNGTLLADTLPCVQSDDTVFKFCKAKPLSLKRFRQTFTVPIIDFYVANGCSRDFVLRHKEKINEMFLSNYETRASKARSRAGAKEALFWLCENRVQNLIFSNHIQSNIDLHLTRLKLRKYFVEVIARSAALDPMNRRNKENLLNEYLQKFKLAPKEVMVIGDTEEEIEIGKTYGFHTVAITGGYNSTARLKKHKPDYMIQILTELIPIISKINFVK